jgi:hypothetical protein
MRYGLQLLLQTATGVDLWGDCAFAVFARFAPVSSTRWEGRRMAIRRLFFARERLFENLPLTLPLPTITWGEGKD